MSWFVKDILEAKGKLDTILVKSRSISNLIKAAEFAVQTVEHNEPNCREDLCPVCDLEKALYEFEDQEND